MSPSYPLSEQEKGLLGNEFYDSPLDGAEARNYFQGLILPQVLASSKLGLYVRVV